MQKLWHYLKLVLVVIGAGTLSGFLVMQIALRDTGDIPAPAIIGDEIVTALEKVTGAGLNLKITELAYHKEAPRNTVISQNPKPGSGLKQGRDIRVVISRGVEDVEMPDLRDLTMRQARNIIDENELPIPTVTKLHSKIEDGKIIAQLPPAGSHLTNLSRVELLLSIGPAEEKFLLANFTGKSLSEVTDKIRTAGLILGRVRYTESEFGENQTVLEQEPSAGRAIIKGAEISLLVNKKTGDSSAPRTYTLYNYTLPSTTGKSAVRVEVENLDGVKVIHNRSHKGGETLSLLVKIAGDTTLSIYVDDELAQVKRF